MIHDVVDIHPGDILIIKTGWARFGWNSPECDEFRYMVKHPGPSPDFSHWAADMQLKWIGVDAVSADHPMNTIMRIWHPKTFEEANPKLIRDFGKDWDQMYPLDQYYQDMHFNLFPKQIVHAENLAGDMSHAKGGSYFIGCFLAESHGSRVDVGPLRGVQGREIMKPAPFDYYGPSSVAEALDRLAELGYAGKVLAGGQSLIPSMNFRLAQPSALVDLNNIKELDYIRASQDGGLLIGAMTRDSRVEHDAMVAQRVSDRVGSHAAHRSPANPQPRHLRGSHGAR